MAIAVLLDFQVTVLSVALLGFMVAVNVAFLPFSSVNSVLFNDTDTTGTTTVTEQFAVKLPAVADIVAEPADLAVTLPFESTVATEVLLDIQVTVLSVALEGVTVADSALVSPTFIVIEDELRLIPVTGITFALTVTVQVAVLPPSLVLTVIVAVPGDFAVTTPEEETAAIEVLFDDQVTDLSVAFEGLTVAVSVSESPSVIVRLVVFKLIPVTETTLALTVTEHVAVLPPSFVLTVIVAVPFFLAVTFPSFTLATLLFDELQEISLYLIMILKMVC